MALILLVGGSDTGRAPMAAALLRRLLAAQGQPALVESAGVLGHDGDPAEIEARDTMAHMGLDIGEHQARSITDQLVADAALLVAIDNGTALVLRARFPTAVAPIHSLGELAGRPRDIPDPFRMQIGAWITYAKEIEALLKAALPRILELLPEPTNDQRPTTNDQRRGTKNKEQRTKNDGPRTTDQEAGERAAAAGRIEQLLQFAVQMPGVVDWAAARLRIEPDLAAIAAAPHGTGDLVAAYVGLLRAALALLPAAPSPGQLAALHKAAARLSGPIDQPDLNDLSAQLALLPGLP
jgi:protein-tyrosine phosphatase